MKKYKAMNQFIRKPKSWAALSLMLIISFLFCLTSCKITKEVAKESLIESIVDPKTGTQVFVKDYDTDPYAINVGGIVKARKDAKKKKAKEILDEY